MSGLNGWRSQIAVSFEDEIVRLMKLKEPQLREECHRGGGRRRMAKLDMIVWGRMRGLMMLCAELKAFGKSACLVNKEAYM